MAGTGDECRSPEPSSRLDTLSPPHCLRKDPPIVDDDPTRLNLSEMLRLRSSSQPVATQPPDGPGLGMEYGYGQPPPLLSSSVLSAELIVYNDLVIDIGAPQYLDSGVQELAASY